LVSRLLLHRLHLDHVAGLEIFDVDRGARCHDLVPAANPLG
jgi:hypothetical protein